MLMRLAGSGRSCGSRVHTSPTLVGSGLASVAGAASELLANGRFLKRPTNASWVPPSPARGWGRTSWGLPPGAERRSAAVGGHQAGRGGLLQRDERPSPSSAPSTSSQKQSPVSLTPRTNRPARQPGAAGVVWCWAAVPAARWIAPSAVISKDSRAPAGKRRPSPRRRASS